MAEKTARPVIPSENTQYRHRYGDRDAINSIFSLKLRNGIIGAKPVMATQIHVHILNVVFIDPRKMGLLSFDEFLPVKKRKFGLLGGEKKNTLLLLSE